MLFFLSSEVAPSSLKYVSETAGLWSPEVFAVQLPHRGQSDPHLCTQGGGRGRCLGEAAPVLLVDGRSARQERNSRKTDGAGARCNGTRGYVSALKRKLCMDVRIFWDNLLFLTQNPDL